MRRQIEPHADIREWAATLRQEHVALTDAGFTEAEAMRLICAQVTASFGGGDDE